jgi:hypothetical protein
MPNNAPHNMLTAYINAAIARGEPVFVEIPAQPKRTPETVTGLTLTISDDQSGEVYLQRKLDDSETLDCDFFAAAYAETMGVELAPKTGHVPLGCGHFTVEIAEQPQTAVCWSSRSYFIKSDGDDA